MAPYVIIASDLHTKHPANKMSKYADDIYLMVGSNNIDTTSEEFLNMRSCSTLNNLSIHPNKTKEMIIYRRLNKRALGVVHKGRPQKNDPFSYPHPPVRRCPHLASYTALWSDSVIAEYVAHAFISS